MGDSKVSTRKLNTDAVEVYVQVKCLSNLQNVCAGNIDEGVITFLGKIYYAGFFNPYLIVYTAFSYPPPAFLARLGVSSAW